MITVDDKLIVTKQLAEVIKRYTLDNVLKLMFNKICFDEPLDERRDMSKLFVGVLENYDCSYGITHSGVKIKLINFISEFIDTLDDADFNGLFFYLTNINYSKELDSFIENEYDEDNSECGSLDEEFGRYLAYKIHYSELKERKSLLLDYLVDLVSSFSDEFDLKDEFSSADVENKIRNNLNFVGYGLTI